MLLDVASYSGRLWGAPSLKGPSLQRSVPSLRRFVPPLSEHCSDKGSSFCYASSLSRQQRSAAQRSDPNSTDPSFCSASSFSMPACSTHRAA